MKAALLLAFFALACGYFGYGASRNSIDDFDPSLPRPPKSMRVVTWNVGSAVGRSGRALDEKYLSSVVATLRRLDADVVFLQELASAAQAKRIAQALGSDVGLVTSPLGGRTGAFFSRRRCTGLGSEFTSGGFRFGFQFVQFREK